MNPVIIRKFIAVLAVFGCGAALAGPVNINNADAEELAAELSGVGLARAQLIIDHRKENGAFASVEALADVQGIGMHIVEVNRDNIRISDASE